MRSTGVRWAPVRCGNSSRLRESIVETLGMPRKANKSGMTKTAFVLSQPMDMPAKELIKRAKAAGLSNLSEKYVYSVRSAHRTKGGKAKSPVRGARAARGRGAAVVRA